MIGNAEISATLNAINAWWRKYKDLKGNDLNKAWKSAWDDSIEVLKQHNNPFSRALILRFLDELESRMNPGASHE